MNKKYAAGIASASVLFTLAAPMAMADTSTSSYTVQSGDSLYKISQKFGVSVSDLVTVNHISNPNNIYVGEVLQLPVVQYTVVSGDSLSKIAQKFGVSVTSIQTQNNISNPNMICVGQVLKISIPATPVPTTTTSAQPTSPTSTATSAPTPVPTSATATQTAPTTSTAPSQTTSAVNIGQALVSTAEGYLGPHPYVWGGNTPAGWDCSGFTSYVFAKNGITLPRVSRDQTTVGTPVAQSDLQPGDLVFFAGTTTDTSAASTVSHVGIYVGNGNFIQESSSQNAVIISSLSNSYWASHYWGARQPF